MTFWVYTFLSPPNHQFEYPVNFVNIYCVSFNSSREENGVGFCLFRFKNFKANETPWKCSQKALLYRPLMTDVSINALMHVVCYIQLVQSTQYFKWLKALINTFIHFWIIKNVCVYYKQLNQVLKRQPPHINDVAFQNAHQHICLEAGYLNGESQSKQFFFF